MKRSLYLLTLLFVGAFLVSAWFTKPVVNATGVDPTATPTPAPKPAATSVVAPTPKPTEPPEEPIKIDTELVNLTVRVVDRNNRSVNDLQAKDFKVFEDGVDQKIEFFGKADVPTNYAMVIDNSGSMRQLLEKVIDAGKILVNNNRPDDEAMIVRFVSQKEIEIKQDFTTNKADLIDTLENMYIEGGQTAIIDAVYLAVERIDEYEKSQKRENIKRRALILVSDGEDRNSFYTEKQLSELLRESEVQIYVIGFISELSKEGGFVSKSPQDKAKSFLERIATQTGGKAYFPISGSELPALATEISNELRTQYSISYEPSNDTKDGTYRNIKVVVGDGPKQEKRIAVTRAGRTVEQSGKPSSPKK